MSWIIANAMRPALRSTPPIITLAIYFFAVVFTGAILGKFGGTRQHGVFSLAFITGFVISPTLIRHAAYQLNGRRQDVGLAGLLLGPMSLLLAISLGFVLGRVSSPYL